MDRKTEQKVRTLARLAGRRIVKTETGYTVYCGPYKGEYEGRFNTLQDAYYSLQSGIGGWWDDAKSLVERDMRNIDGTPKH